MNFEKNKDSILLTGGNGLIGKSLTKLFKENNYNIHSLDKSDLDVCNSREVEEFFREKKPTIVIHAAVKGGRRTTNDDISILYDNLLGFENVFSNFQKYCKDGLFINFTSAAELDRRFDILDYDDCADHKTIPIDYYGFSKYLITKRLRAEQESSLNLRLFYTFAETEEQDRFISTCIRKAKNNEEIEIFEDKYFGFFYIEDLFNLIAHQIHINNKHKEFNCVYPELSKLSDVAKFIIKTINSQSKLTIGERGLNYSAKSSNLEYLYSHDLLKPIGLFQGIKNLIEIKN